MFEHLSIPSHISCIERPPLSERSINEGMKQMKNISIAALATTLVLAAGSAFANDLVAEDTFFNNVANGKSVTVENTGAVSSTLDVKTTDDDVVATSSGPHNPH